MTKLQLTTLLRRFMDGTTTIDEEVALADFFSHATDADRPGDVPIADWLAYREMFAMFEQDAADAVLPQGQAPALRCVSHRWIAGWVAAAAVALLVVVGMSWLQRPGNPAPMTGGSPLAELPTEAVGDSIAVPRQQVATDSVQHRSRKGPAVRTRRPYWQPRPPKVYVAAKADNVSMAESPADDARLLEEAVGQADMLLRAINAHQSAELDLLQSQVVEVLDVDADVNADDGEDVLW